MARRFDIACIDFDYPSGAPMQERSHVAGGWATVTRLVACPSFVIQKVRMAEGTRHPLARSELAVWIIFEGTGTIEWGPDAEPSRFGPGNVILLPAQAPAEACVRIAAATQWLEVTVPCAASPICI